MTQIKLSIAFVLAAAAIAPIVAQPIRESHEFSGDVVPHRHPHHPHHHRHHHHHHHHDVAIPEQSPLESTFDTTPPLSSREYEDEFEARSLLPGHNDFILGKMANKDKSLEVQLEHENQVLESENSHLRNIESHFEHKNHHLGRQGRKLEHRKQSLVRQDKSLSGKKDHLEHVDHKLAHKHKTLKEQDKTLKDKHHSLSHKNKALGKKDKKLAHKGHVLAHHDDKLKHDGKALAHHDKVLTKEGEVLAHHNKVLTQEGKALSHRPVIHSEPIIVDREYADHDEVFERDESAGHPLPPPRYRGRFRFGYGTVPHPRRTIHFPAHFGPGLEIPPQHRPTGPMIVDREYVDVEDVVERDFEDDEFEAREYADVEDVVERDFEDDEFEARDFDEELYLD